MTATADETQIMGILAEVFQQPAARHFLAGACHALRHQLTQSPQQTKSTHAPIPLDVYGAGLPGDIRSSWVFVLRPGFVHPPERHPNSIQRMFALDCAGAMEVWEDGDWVRRDLAPGPRQAGLSIPKLAWHRPAVLGQMWGVVSFHTARDDELIEEIGDPASELVLGRRNYVE